MFTSVCDFERERDPGTESERERKVRLGKARREGMEVESTCMCNVIGLLFESIDWVCADE